jgi:hypothetical protein
MLSSDESVVARFRPFPLPLPFFAAVPGAVFATPVGFAAAVLRGARDAVGALPGGLLIVSRETRPLGDGACERVRLVVGKGGARERGGMVF